MHIEPLSIAGAFVVTPRQFPDDRGVTPASSAIASTWER